MRGAVLCDTLRHGQPSVDRGGSVVCVGADPPCVVSRPRRSLTSTAHAPGGSAAAQSAAAAISTLIDEMSVIAAPRHAMRRARRASRRCAGRQRRRAWQWAMGCRPCARCRVQSAGESVGSRERPRVALQLRRAQGSRWVTSHAVGTLDDVSWVMSTHTHRSYGICRLRMRMPRSRPRECVLCCNRMRNVLWCEGEDGVECRRARGWDRRGVANAACGRPGSGVARAAWPGVARRVASSRVRCVGSARRSGESSESVAWRRVAWCRATSNNSVLYV